MRWCLHYPIYDKYFKTRCIDRRHRVSYFFSETPLYKNLGKLIKSGKTNKTRKCSTLIVALGAQSHVQDTLSSFVRPVHIYCLESTFLPRQEIKVKT